MASGNVAPYVGPSDIMMMHAVADVAGLNVKEADAPLMRLLEERGALYRSGRIVHSYPFCWRTDTPLIYKAIPTWFVRVEAFRDRMAELNQRILQSGGQLYLSRDIVVHYFPRESYKALAKQYFKGRSKVFDLRSEVT